MRSVLSAIWSALQMFLGGVVRRGGRDVPSPLDRAYESPEEFRQHFEQYEERDTFCEDGQWIGKSK